MTAKSFLILALSLSLGACAFKKENSESDKAKNATDVIEALERQAFDGQLSENNVRIEFIESDEPEFYSLNISWPKPISMMKVSIDGQPYTFVKNTNSFQKKVIHSKKIKIHLVALNAMGGEISSYPVETFAPADFLIDEDIYLQKHERISVNRLYFLNNSKILTNGYNLDLKANKLFTNLHIKSDASRMNYSNAHILTNFPNETAKEKEFLRGSIISIAAKKAIGQLRIAMVGLNGQNGADGMDALPNAGLNGAHGKDAVGSGRPRCDETGCRSAPVCSASPTNGEAGQNGTPGENGQDGWDAGSVGILSVIVEDYSDFRLEVLMRRGLPGKGGRGGKGSPGGIGGNPGQDRHNLCVGKASRGQNGMPGPAGQDGKDGKASVTSEVINNTPRAIIYETH